MASENRMKRRIVICLIITAAVSAILFVLTLPGPRLQYVATQPKDQNGTIHLAYELRNRSSWPMYYYGYGPAMPLYRAAYRIGSDWKTHPIGWCGTGAHYNRLGPWRSAAVYVAAGSVDTSKVFCVGIPYRRTTWMLPYELVFLVTKRDFGDHCVWSKGLEIGGQHPPAN